MGADPHERGELVRLLAANSLISVPLQARGELFGTLTLVVWHDIRAHVRPRRPDFAAILGGRAALALEIAGLTRRMTQLEQRLVSALGNVSDAISVFDPTGAVLYVSEAALQLVGVDSFEEFTAAGNLTALGFEVYTEDHAPATREDLPLAADHPRRARRAADAADAPERHQREERWLRASSRPVRDSAGGKLRSVVGRFEDITESTRAQLATRTLARASELLSTSLDYETVVERIAALAVERLADFCAVYLPDARGTLRRVAAAGASSERGQRMLGQLSTGPTAPAAARASRALSTKGARD